MIVIETCPNCGEPLIDIMLTSNPPIPRKECFSCGWSWTGEPEKIEYKPFEEAKRMTEADKIRSFTDEELANFLAVTIGTSVVAANMASGNTIDKEGYDNYINELKSGYLKQLKRDLQNDYDKI